MKEDILVIWTILFLIIGGSIGIAVRSLVSRHAKLGRGDSLWQVRFQVFVHPEKDDTVLTMSLPSDTIHLKKLKQTFFHPGFSMYQIKKKETGNQQVIAAVESWRNIVRFETDFRVHVFPYNSKDIESAVTILKNDRRYHYLRSEKEIQVKNPRIRSMAKHLAEGIHSKIMIVETIYTYCSEQIADGSFTDAEDALGTLSAHKGSSLGRVRLMTALCRANHIPARLVTGFILEEGSDASPHYWLEIYLKKRWVSYDPVNNFAKEVPAHYLPVHRDSIHFVKINDKSPFTFHCQIKKDQTISHLSADKNLGWLAVFDLTRLPLSIQEILALLLLLPAGALITSIFRNLIGIQTIGTFTPALLALSFVYTDWRIGLVIFTIIFSIGLASRCFFDYMKLLMIPRLSVLLTLIVLCLTLSVSLLDFLKLSLNARMIILPIVIVTMMIERFYIHSEEDSVFIAFQLLMGTLLVSFICFILLKWHYMGRLVIQFPEIEFLIAACLIIVGRYTGYRVSELWRFRDFKDFTLFRK
ncbi:MAG: 7TM domain-containing protein [bacterium]